MLRVSTSLKFTRFVRRPTLKAVANDDREGIALAALAKLYSAAGRRDSAAKCYEAMLANRSADRDVRSLYLLLVVPWCPSLWPVCLPSDGSSALLLVLTRGGMFVGFRVFEDKLDSWSIMMRRRWGTCCIRPPPEI